MTHRHKRLTGLLVRTWIENDVKSNFPYMRNLVDLFQEGQEKGLLNTKVDARRIIAAIGSMNFGLVFIKDILFPTLGLEMDKDENLLDDILSDIFYLLQEKNN
jgi:uncharacterized protein Usg